jgi:hypothetical protein
MSMLIGSSGGITLLIWRHPIREMHRDCLVIGLFATAMSHHIRPRFVAFTLMDTWDNVTLERIRATTKGCRA